MQTRAAYPHLVQSCEFDLSRTFHSLGLAVLTFLHLHCFGIPMADRRDAPQFKLPEYACERIRKV